LDPLEGDGRRGANARRRELGLTQLPGERHREASGVRRRHELLGIGAGAVLEARGETVARVLEHAALGRDRALAGFEITLPDRTSLPLHRILPLAWTIHEASAASGDLAALAGGLGARTLRRIAEDTTRVLAPTCAHHSGHLRALATNPHE